MPPVENLEDQVNSRLEQLYGEDSQTPNLERLILIMKFLADDLADGLKKNPEYISPHYRILGGARGNFLFQRYAENLVPQLSASESPRPRTQIAEDDLPDPDQILAFPIKSKRSIGIEGTAVCATTGVVKAVPYIPAAVLSLVKSSTGKLVATAVDETVAIASVGAGSLVMGGIAAAYISYECYDNIKKWIRGDISGKRCAKNIIDSTVQVAAGVGGGMIGAVAGTAVFPGVGTFVGGVVGGIAGSLASFQLSQYLTEKIFNLPPTVALENAYNFLEVDKSISNGELNQAFRKKALSFHPDKGGNAEDFHKLQYHFAIIKASREGKKHKD